MGSRIRRVTVTPERAALVREVARMVSTEAAPAAAASGGERFRSALRPA